VLVQHPEKGMSKDEKYGRQPRGHTIGVLIPRQVSDREEKVEVTSINHESCQHDNNELRTFTQTGLCHVVDGDDAAAHKSHEGYAEHLNTAANRSKICCTTNYVRIEGTIARRKPYKGVGTRRPSNDDRDVTAEQLRSKTCESSNLSPQQQDSLYEVLL
jgi:hypothetical protein